METDENETKTGHLYKLIISLLKKEKAQPQTEGCFFMKLHRFVLPPVRFM